MKNKERYYKKQKMIIKNYKKYLYVKVHISNYQK